MVAAVIVQLCNTKIQARCANKPVGGIHGGVQQVEGPTGGLVFVRMLHQKTT